jgi:hypothetical protein
MLYFSIAVISVALLLAAMIYKGNRLVGLFWDSYRIFVLTGGQEARAALIIGLSTVGQKHKEQLLYAIGRDLEEIKMMLHLARTSTDDDVNEKMRAMDSSFEALSKFDESEVLAIKQVYLDADEIVSIFSETKTSALLSAEVKSKFTQNFPEMVSAINKFHHNYFRNKYPTFKELSFNRRLKVWKQADLLHKKAP